MKTLLKDFFVLPLLLFSFLSIVPTYGQGPPSIKKTETRDGGDGAKPNCIDPTVGRNFIGYEITLEDRSYLEECTLLVNLSKGTTLSILSPGPNDFIYDHVRDLHVFSFYVSFTPEEVDSICSGGEFHFSIDVSCLEDGRAESDDPNPSTLYPTCCESELEEEQKPVDVLIGGRQRQSDSQTKEEENNVTDFSPSTENRQRVDYYLFDTNGSLIDILENKSKTLDLQAVISNLNINSGIYFVSYRNGTEVITQKVLRY